MAIRLSDKLTELKKSYVEKMPEKILMSDDVARKIDKTDVEWDEFYELPEVYYPGDDYAAYTLKVIRYENGKMRCIDPNSDEITEYEVRYYTWLFPLEVLAQINEY